MGYFSPLSRARASYVLRIAPNRELRDADRRDGRRTVDRKKRRRALKVRRVQGREDVARRERSLVRINAATPRHALRLFRLASAPRLVKHTRGVL